MKFDDVRDVLASRGLTGSDAETAFNSWQKSPTGSDGCRVQRTLEVTGMSPPPDDHEAEG